MTVVEDRPTDVTSVPAPALDSPRWMPGASWRLAARLARREVRRRPGRTFLVALLVTVPILAMTVGSILVRSNTDEAGFVRRFGTADIALTQYRYVDQNGGTREPTDLATLAAGLVPDGTTSTEILEVYTTVSAADIEPVLVVATRFDPASPITDGIFEVSSGELPTADDKVLLHPSVAKDLDVGVGDRLVLERPARTLTVTGLGRPTSDFNNPIMLFGALDASDLRDSSLTTLVDLPSGVDANRFLDSVLAARGENPDLQNINVELRSDGWYDYSGGLADQQTQTLAWGWVVGVLMLAALSVIVVAAFATSARRQLATVGQLAANGASPRLIRRTLSLQGTWSGVVGSLAGIVIGVGLFLLATPLVERIAGRSWTNTTIRPLDLVVLFVTGSAAATIAALVPSRSLANTSVLQALAGRRPIRPVRARTVTVGIVCFLAGLFLLAVAAAAGQANSDGGGDSNLFALVAVLGGVGVLACMCLASPIAITASTAVASRLSASWKLSGRSLYRTRWRSAAVVTAIGVAGAFAVAAGTVANGLGNDTVEGPTDMPLDQAVLRANSGSDVSDVSTLDPGVLRDVRKVMAPSAESMVYGIALAQPSEEESTAAFEAASSRDEAGFVTAYDVTIADAALLDGMGLSAADRAQLDEVGAMALWRYGYSVEDGPSIDESDTETLRLLGPDTVISFGVGLFADYASRNGVNSIVMTEERADELGLEVIPVGVRFNGDHDLTATQRRQLDAIRFDTEVVDSWIVGDEPSDYSGVEQGFWIDYQYVNYTPSTALVQAAIAGAALLLVLVVIAIGLSLAAAESRDERNTLIAIGASPKTLRRRSATTATLLAVTGGVLAVPTGLIPVAVVMRTVEEPFSVPWLSILAVVVVIPISVGFVALLGSAATQRIRPPKVMRDRTD